MYFVVDGRLWAGTKTVEADIYDELSSKSKQVPYNDNDGESGSNKNYEPGGFSQSELEDTAEDEIHGSSNKSAK